MSEFSLHPQLEKDCFFVCDLELSRVLLMNDSNYPWCILVPRIDGVREVYELSEARQQMLTRESVLVARVLMELFDGVKMNVAALGNVVPQLHVHHVVRKINDPAWPKPVWGCVQSVPYDENSAKEICRTIAAALR